ncbi:endonuclease/exonuclease/phosphatase family protein [Crocinitomix algicola]|uniref:endonuclease/exonuclease/phosphatase family protein n=1 Tax=Crocinitomix algicola TaxID=1740263 RepID=UPI001FE13B81|nr:endonuclease/exonuclease/phosphatase family protein [Crocinitomix algicola]
MYKFELLKKTELMIRMNYLIIGILTIFYTGFQKQVYGQEQKSYKVACVGFYNLENLFDTEDDPKIKDEEFMPNGRYAWTNEKYNNKLNNMADVIADLGTSSSPDGMAVLGVSEVENKKVLEDLVKQEKIAHRNYKIIHFDSPDRRGIDVGLLYQEKYFKPTNSVSYELKFKDFPDYYTRDQLVVSGELDGDKITFIVVHWPSRSGGQAASEPRRVDAANLGRHIVDSLLLNDPNARIVLMGDLNDDPVDKSVKEALSAKGKISKLKEKDLFNPMFRKFKTGDCTLAYRDAWNLFDQLIISQGLLSRDETEFVYHRAYVYSKDYLKQKEGRYKGYPLRTHAGGEYLNGYSDHFPVYMVLKKLAN